ncbi:MAG: sulfatase-like hydrolase/transferase [Verrucomicrobiota bacterium]
MNPRLFLALWYVLMAPLFGAAGGKPNVLLIVSDDQGWPDLGVMKIKDIQTPNLDRIANEGVRGTQFYVTWPACTPSRSSVLTGRYPQRNGLYDMVRNDLVNYGHVFGAEEYAVSPEMTLGLDPREKTLGDLLKGAGYRTGMVGKWDMGQAKRYLPLQRGFDFFYGHGNNGIDYYTHERYRVPSMFSGNARTEADKGTYATDLFKREALRFIEAAPAGKPWFLYLCFNAPHSASAFDDEPVAKNGKKSAVGVQVSAKYAKPYRDKGVAEKLANYYGAVTCMDEAIGDVLKQIDARGETKDTLVIFISDNGGSGNGGNAPLKGSKSTMWEGGLSVPFLARWPAKLPAGKVTDEFLTSLEFFPTIAAATQAKLPKDVKLDGFDMTAVLRGEKKSLRTEMFWERRKDHAVRMGNWKWVQTGGVSGLYDMVADRGEKNDLSKEKPEIAAKLKARFATWKAEMEAAEPRGPFRDY